MLDIECLTFGQNKGCGERIVLRQAQGSSLLISPISLNLALPISLNLALPESESKIGDRPCAENEEEILEGGEMKFYKGDQWQLGELGEKVKAHFTTGGGEVRACDFGSPVLIPRIINEDGLSSNQICGCVLIIESTAHVGEPFGTGNYVRYVLVVGDDCPDPPVPPTPPWKEVGPGEAIYDLLLGLPYRGKILENPLILQNLR